MERTPFGRLAGWGVAPRGGGVVEKTAGDARWRPRCIARIVAHYHPQGNGVKQREKLVLAVYFVRNSQLLAALGTTSGQYAATISRLHALTETMFVVSLAVVGLECSFHCVYAVFCLLSWASRTAGTGARATAVEGRRGGSSIFGVQRYANFLKCRKVLA